MSPPNGMGWDGLARIERLNRDSRIRRKLRKKSMKTNSPSRSPKNKVPKARVMPVWHEKHAHHFNCAVLPCASPAQAKAIVKTWNADPERVMRLIKREGGR